MLDTHGYPVVDEAGLEPFLATHGEVVLFFSEDPRQFPESDDVAMILPELVEAFGGRFQAALVDREAEQALQRRFGFATWPSLVFLRNGRYLGVVSRVQNWEDYLRLIGEILESDPVGDPGIGVPLVAEPAAGRH
jgi:hydrogenase-1 operon protein HyaE